VRRGLSEAQREPWRFWDQVAARMVDAQAPGLATRVRAMGSTTAAGGAWAERLLEQAALLHLLLDAYARLDELPADVQADVRQLIGWTVPTEEVLAGGRVRDEWAVVGQMVVEDDRLRAQRTWLRGATNGRDALVLAFAAAGQVLDPGVTPGTIVDASLVFYPGAAPLRALVAERHGDPRPLDRIPGHQGVDAALAARAEHLARNPWLDRFPVPLRAVRPARAGDGWAIVDGDGGALPLAARRDWWPLVALSGGHAVDVFGELDGDRMIVLGAVADGRTVSFA